MTARALPPQTCAGSLVNALQTEKLWAFAMVGRYREQKSSKVSLLHAIQSALSKSSGTSKIAVTVRGLMESWAVTPMTSHCQ